MNLAPFSLGIDCRENYGYTIAFRMRLHVFRLLGRSQAVRQWILIPPFGGSIPPAPTRTTSNEFQ